MACNGGGRVTGKKDRQRPRLRYNPVLIVYKIIKRCIAFIYRLFFPKPIHTSSIAAQNPIIIPQHNLGFFTVIE